jgi:Ricin-type beta-trefoil lectin domain-like
LSARTTFVALSGHSLSASTHIAPFLCVVSTVDGANVQQWTDNGTEAQRFSIVVTDSSDPTAFSIMNENSSKCLDDQDWSTADRGNIQQWSCSGGTNQSFRFYPIGSTTPISVN